MYLNARLYMRRGLCTENGGTSSVPKLYMETRRTRECFGSRFKGHRRTSSAQRWGLFVRQTGRGTPTMLIGMLPFRQVAQESRMLRNF